MELLIVVTIIGVVYNLAVSNFQRIGQEEQKVTLKTLKEYMQNIPHEKSVKFLCLDDCSSCDLFIDGDKRRDLSGVFDEFIDDSIKVYTYDYSLGMSLKRDDVYFNEENVEEEVCFSYEIDKKGVGEQVFIEFKDKIYDFTTYLIPTQTFATLEDAVEDKERLVVELR